MSIANLSPVLSPTALKISAKRFLVRATPTVRPRFVDECTA
nr:MAG TPA: hypothetical protein [Caudoviricetes sp.]